MTVGPRLAARAMLAAVIERAVPEVTRQGGQCRGTTLKLRAR